MQISLEQVRQNAAAIRRKVKVPVLAVVKADAYGLGAAAIARAIGDVVDGFCVHTLAEAQAANLWDIAGKPILALGPAEMIDANDYLAAHVRPSVFTVEQAKHLVMANPILCVDTGMQRFACPPENIDAVLAAAPIEEAFTHAIKTHHVEIFREMMKGRGLRLHAAASALLDEPSVWLDAVRPGIALYRSAARVSTTFVDVRDSHGPVGYRGFSTGRFGIIRCGYSNGLRRGPCLVNTSPRQILEVGMQTAYVEAGPNDKIGDEVVLLGDGLTELFVAQSWQTSEHEALLNLARIGVLEYREK